MSQLSVPLRPPPTSTINGLSFEDSPCAMSFIKVSYEGTNYEFKFFMKLKFLWVGFSELRGAPPGV